MQGYTCDRERSMRSCPNPPPMSFLHRVVGCSPQRRRAHDIAPRRHSGPLFRPSKPERRLSLRERTFCQAVQVSIGERRLWPFSNAKQAPRCSCLGPHPSWADAWIPHRSNAIRFAVINRLVRWGPKRDDPAGLPVRAAVSACRPCWRRPPPSMIGKRARPSAWTDRPPSDHQPRGSRPIRSLLYDAQLSRPFGLPISVASIPPTHGTNAA